MIKNASAPGTLVWPLPRASLPSAPVEQRFTAGVAYVEGQFCPIEEARIPLLDWGCYPFKCSGAIMGCLV